MILSSNFVSFWRHFFVFYPLIWQENIVIKEENFVMAPICFYTFFPGERVLCVCFFLLLSLGVWGCGRGAF